MMAGGDRQPQFLRLDCLLPKKPLFLGNRADLPSAVWVQSFVDVPLREVFGQHRRGRLSSELDEAISPQAT